MERSGFQRYYVVQFGTHPPLVPAPTCLGHVAIYETLVKV